MELRRGPGAQPDTARLALLLQRTRYSPLLASESALTPLVSSRRSIAVTNAQALDSEARATFVALHGDQRDDDSDASREATGCQKSGSAVDEARVPALHELEELVRDLLELYARGSESFLSPLERELADTLELTVVATLVQATFGASKQPQPSTTPLGGVHVWLLELAVRPAALSRQLAFTIFYNASVYVAAAVLDVVAADAQSAPKDRCTSVNQLESQLFLVLLEMLSKAVVVASSSRVGPVAARTLSPTDSGGSSTASELAWIAPALSCTLLFIRDPRGWYCADRLRALDPSILRFFLGESSQQGRRTTQWSSVLDAQLVELVVAAMYAHESSVCALNTASSEPGGPSHRSHVRIVLAPTALERFGGLELLLALYYHTPSLATQRLLFMVFFDVAYYQQHHQHKTLDTMEATIALEDELWRLLQRGDVANVVASTPYLFAASSTSRTVKQLYALAPPTCTQSLSEKQLHHFINHLRVVLHVDEYFAQSPSLSTTITVLRDQATHDVPEALMAKVWQLIASSRAEERFQGERWLAQLVRFGVPLSGATAPNADSSACGTPSTTRQLSESVVFTGSDVVELETSRSLHVGVVDLEETCCFDEDAGIRFTARTKFWELARSASVTQRESFARTLSVFVRRKLGMVTRQSELASIAREISACVSVAVEQQESSERVLAPLLLLVVAVCRTRVSHQDLRRQEYDRKSTRSSTSDVASDSHDLWPSRIQSGSDSLVAQFTSGKIALDVELLGLFRPDFFVHALSILEPTAHPRRRCRQRCCGTRSSSTLTSDLAECAALLLTKRHDSDAALEWGDRIHALLPLVDACNARVAVVVSRLIVSVLKRKSESDYTEALRELHARAADADDAMALTLSHVHVRELVRTSKEHQFRSDYE